MRAIRNYGADRRGSKIAGAGFRRAPAKYREHVKNKSFPPPARPAIVTPMAGMDFEESAAFEAWEKLYEDKIKPLFLE